MKTDTEISYEGFSILFKYMDMIDAERFITLLQREKFDYTRWREHLFEDLTIEEISARAMEYVRAQETHEEQE